MGRPKNPPDRPARVPVGVRFSPPALAIFDKLAAEHGMDRSEVVRRLAARGYRSLKTGEKP